MPKLTAKRNKSATPRATASRKAKKQQRWTPALLTAHLRRTSLGAGIVLAITLGVIATATDIPNRLWGAATHAGWSLSADAGLRVEELVVYGLDRTSGADARAALAIERGDPILQLDMHGAYERLNSLPWIASAQLRRQLPDRLVVRVTERSPLAIWRDGRHIGIIDEAGQQIMPVVPAGLETLPVVLGPSANEAALALLDAFAERPDIAQHIVASRRIAGQRWDLQLDTGVVVRLPADDLDQAFDRLARRIEDDTIANEGVIAIDLRQDDRTIYKLSPEALALLAEMKESS